MIHGLVSVDAKMITLFTGITAGGDRGHSSTTTAVPLSVQHDLLSFSDNHQLLVSLILFIHLINLGLVL